MQIRLETQGSNVTIDDLGGVVFTDPSTTTLYDTDVQANPYSLDELRCSTDLQAAIDATDIVLKDQNDNEFATVLAATNAASQGGWIPPTLTLGDNATSGVGLFVNSGAGWQMSFDAGSDDDIYIEINLAHNGIEYDGSDLKLALDNQLFNTAPVGGDNVKWSVRYAFVMGDGTEDAESKLSGSFEDTIDVSARTANRLYEDELSTMTGEAGAKVLGISLTRNSTGGGSDTYGNAVDLFGLTLYKQ